MPYLLRGCWGFTHYLNTDKYMEWIKCLSCLSHINCITECPDKWKIFLKNSDKITKRISSQYFAMPSEQTDTIIHSYNDVHVTRRKTTRFDMASSAFLRRLRGKPDLNPYLDTGKDLQEVIRPEGTCWTVHESAIGRMETRGKIHRSFFKGQIIKKLNNRVGTFGLKK